MFTLLSSLLLVFIVGLHNEVVLADQFSGDYEKYNNADYGKHPTQTFVSNPDIVAPLIQVNVWNEDKISQTGGSHIFLRHDLEESSPLILDAKDLSVVYMNRAFDRTSDIRVQKNFDQSYLTFYSGSIVDGHGQGDGMVLDDQYNEVYRVNVQGLGAVKNDLHEFQFTGNGTALVTAYDTIRRDLKAFRGARKGRVLDGVFQEVDLETKEVLFQWRASDHVELGDSFYRLEPKWDFFHINSIQKSKAGNYLISARHMHSIYLINGQTGEIMWTLGGKKNQFREIPAEDGANPSGSDLLSFKWQHHARFLGDSEDEITFFDNHGLDTRQNCEKDCSRGVRMRLNLDDPDDPTVQIVREYLHPQSLQAQSQGSVQPLDDGSGNVFVGWGRCPTFTEHTADGEVVMDVQFSPWHTRENSKALDNYRAFRMDWKAAPPWDPDAMSQKAEDTGVVSIYASWNGATEVKSWAFLASNESSDLFSSHKVIAIVPRNGFETSLALEYPARFARAAAIDADWNVIGSSGIVDVANERVFGEIRPVTGVLNPTENIIYTDGGDGYSISATTGSSDEGSHADFPGELVVLGRSVGWQTGLGCMLLVGLFWTAVRFR